MIIHLIEKTTQNQAFTLAEKLQSVCFHNGWNYVLVTPSAVRELPEEAEPFTEFFKVSSSDIQLASVDYLAEKRSIHIGDSIEIGGSTQNCLFITGPCSVESEEQIRSAAALCQTLGVKVLRAGAYKPRTSPYSFQGLGLEGLQLLAKMREEFGLKIITEIRDATHADAVIEFADIVQIGAKSMYDHGILRKCGAIRKPVLLKRGFGATVQEFVQAAEFILSGGNPNVILCERGIRTFETKTRFTLDLCGVAWLKEFTNLPVFLDPSHAMGYAYGVPDLTRACLAMGVDGLLIESHPNPPRALSDASQQLNFAQTERLYHSLKNLSAALDINLI